MTDGPSLTHESVLATACLPPAPAAGGYVSVCLTSTHRAWRGRRGAPPAFIGVDPLSELDGASLVARLYDHWVRDRPALPRNNHHKLLREARSMAVAASL